MENKFTIFIFLEEGEEEGEGREWDGADGKRWSNWEGWKAGKDRVDGSGEGCGRFQEDDGWKKEDEKIKTG